MGKESLHKFLFFLTFDPDLHIPYHSFFSVPPHSMVHKRTLDRPRLSPLPLYTVCVTLMESLVSCSVNCGGGCMISRIHFISDVWLPWMKSMREHLRKCYALLLRNTLLLYLDVFLMGWQRVNGY